MVDRINLWALGLVARVQAVREEDGQALVEYALILALVSVVAAAVLKVTGTDIQKILSDSAATTAPPRSAPIRSASLTSPIPSAPGLIAASTKNARLAPKPAASQTHQRLGSSAIRAIRATAAAGRTMRLGTLRWSRSIADSATSTAAPSAATGAVDRSP